MRATRSLRISIGAHPNSREEKDDVKRANMHRETRIVTAFSQLSDIQDHDFTITSYANSLALHTVKLLQVDAAGVLLAGDAGTLDLYGATTDSARFLQLTQLKLQAGPGIDSINANEMVSAPDLRTETRWGQLPRAALDAGFTAIYGVPMRLWSDAIGSITLFRESAGDFGGDELILSEGLAHVATAFLLSRQAIERSEDSSVRLQHALDARIAIEQAKGILGERRKCSLNSAFDAIQNFSQRTGRPLVEVANDVINSSHTVSTPTMPSSAPAPGRHSAVRCKPAPSHRHD
jgi:hypothetical protein